MAKKDLVILIEAYCAAKISRNEHLISIMISQLERALDTLDTTPEAVTPEF